MEHLLRTLLIKNIVYLLFIYQKIVLAKNVYVYHFYFYFKSDFNFWYFSRNFPNLTIFWSVIVTKIHGSMRIYFFLLFLTSREIFERIAFKPE
jgi:hypothetical protein